jgi:hypothetical protein
MVTALSVDAQPAAMVEKKEPPVNQRPQILFYFS